MKVRCSSTVILIHYHQQSYYNASACSQTPTSHCHHLYLFIVTFVIMNSVNTKFGNHSLYKPIARVMEKGDLSLPHTHTHTEIFQRILMKLRITSRTPHHMPSPLSLPLFIVTFFAFLGSPRSHFSVLIPTITNVFNQSLLDYSITSCLDVALRLERHRLTSFVSSLALDKRRLPHFPLRLGDTDIPDCRRLAITLWLRAKETEISAAPWALEA